MSPIWGSTKTLMMMMMMMMMMCICMADMHLDEQHAYKAVVQASKAIE